MSLFDIIAPLSPFNKTASMVAGKGEHFEFEPSNREKIHSRDPIPCRTPNRDELMKPTFMDLTGAKIGRLRVLGVAADIPWNGNGQRWVVRCVCGSYEVRKAKSIKAVLAGTSGDPEPMCDACGYTRKLQQGYHNPKKAAAAAEAIQEAAR